MWKKFFLIFTSVLLFSVVTDCKSNTTTEIYSLNKYDGNLTDLLEIKEVNFQGDLVLQNLLAGGTQPILTFEIGNVDISNVKSAKIFLREKGVNKKPDAASIEIIYISDKNYKKFSDKCFLEIDAYNFPNIKKEEPKNCSFLNTNKQNIQYKSIMPTLQTYSDIALEKHKNNLWISEDISKILKEHFQGKKLISIKILMGNDKGIATVYFYDGNISNKENRPYLEIKY